MKIVENMEKIIQKSLSGDKMTKEDFDFIQLIIKDSYYLIRLDKGIIEPLHKALEELIRALISSSEENDELYNRIMSLISLDFDMRLQKDLSKELVDEYYGNVLSLISKKAFLTNVEAPLKIMEMIAKIQYAYNLLDCGISIVNTYDETLKLINDNKCYSAMLDFLSESSENRTPCDYYHIEMGLVYFYKYLFFSKEEKKDNELYYDFILKQIITYWKVFKQKSYNMSLEEVWDEGISSYDFIYKD
jgi:hypothetical protein